MQIKQKIYFVFILIVNLFLYNCSKVSSKTIVPNNSSQSQIENNKVKISIEKQKNKIIELERLINELNIKIEYQENMLTNFSDEFKDQLDIVNKYDSSSSEITQTLMKMKNKFEVLEDRAFYTDSVYFEIVNDLVKIDSKIQILSNDYHQKNNPSEKILISDQEYSRRYYAALDSFIHSGMVESSLDEFENLIEVNNEHSLSDNCQYWIGEIYYKQKLFEKSILEFKKVSAFQDSNKLDDAQFKIVLCYVNLNNYDFAYQELNKLKDRFSNSEYVDKAEKLVNKLIK